MAVLKIPAASLFETLVALFLVLFVFVLSAMVVQRFSFVSLDTKRMNERNGAQALAYFYYFGQNKTLEKKRSEWGESVLIEREEGTSKIVVVIQNSTKETSYHYVME